MARVRLLDWYCKCILESDGMIKALIPDRNKNNNLIVLNFYFGIIMSPDNLKYPHMNDYKKLSSSLMYSPV